MSSFPGGRESLLVKPSENLQVVCLCSNNALYLRCTEIRPALLTPTAPVVPPGGPQYRVEESLPIHLHIATCADVENEPPPAYVEKEPHPKLTTVDLPLCGIQQLGPFIFQPLYHQQYQPQKQDSDTTSSAHEGRTTKDDNTEFFRQQIQDVVREATESEPSTHSCVCRSQTAPDVRIPMSAETPGCLASIPSGQGVTSTQTSVWAPWPWGQPMSRSVDSLVTTAKKNSMNQSSKALFTLDRHELSRLNDIDSNTAYCTALEKIRHRHFHSQSFSLLDVTPGFSILPLQALKIGAKDVGVLETANHSHAELLCCLASANGFSSNDVRFLSGNVEETEPEWDVIVTELVDHCGALTQQVLEQIALAR